MINNIYQKYYIKFFKYNFLKFKYKIFIMIENKYCRYFSIDNNIKKIYI